MGWIAGAVACAMVCVSAVARAAAAGAVAGAESANAPALVDLGDGARLARVFAKAGRGEPITVAVLGGSITQGYAASAPEHRYSDLVAEWWRRTFPRAKVTLVNAGIGATGSNYGCLRVGRDVLSKRPDFVIVEYAVNDQNTRACAETLEGTVRQILAAPGSPACVLLFMSNSDGSNAQEWHAKVGRHYGLPMVSYRDGLWAEIRAGRLKWTDVSPDVVHPNDRGHAMAAGYVTAMLEREMARTGSNAEAPAPMPPPLFTDRYEHVGLYEAADLKPVANRGWSYDEKDSCWKATEPGSVVEFEVPGRAVSVMYYRIHGAMGRAQVEVDGGAPAALDGWFDQTWGGYRHTQEVASELSPGTHRVRVTLEEDKAAESGGREFRLMGLGVAGLDARGASDGGAVGGR